MAKFSGLVGYATTEESAPGVWREIFTERKHAGDVVRNATQFQADDSVNKDVAVENSISVVADAYANEHFFAIRYVKWAGVNWSVTSVEINHPRLLLRLGGVYNGQTAS